MTLKIGALTKLGLFFAVVCFIHVFDQTLAEQLYRDKGLLSNLRRFRNQTSLVPLPTRFVFVQLETLSPSEMHDIDFYYCS